MEEDGGALVSMPHLIFFACFARLHGCTLLDSAHKCHRERPREELGQQQGRLPEDSHEDLCLCMQGHMGGGSAGAHVNTGLNA